MEFSKDEKALILDGLSMLAGSAYCEAVRIESHLSRESDGRITENRFSRAERERCKVISNLIERVKHA